MAFSPEQENSILLEDIEQFSIATSHELADPLHEALGLCAQVKSGAGEHSALVGRIESCVQVALDNVLALREFTYLIQNKERVTQVHLDEKVEAILQQCGAYHYRVEKLPLPVIEGREKQLDILFTQVIRNAVQYNTSPSPLLRITAEDKGENWLFCIEDNGKGIEEEYQEFIFGLFRRCNDDIVPEGKGAGLALAKKVVQNHAGTIWIESEPGSYTKLYISLPKQQQE